MTHEDIVLLSATSIAFVAIFGIVVAVGMEIQRRQSAKTRLNRSESQNPNSYARREQKRGKERAESIITNRISQAVDVDILSGLVSDSQRTILSITLIRAGYFDSRGPAIFIALTIISIVICAIIGAICIRIFLNNLPIFMQLAILGVSAYVGYFIPDIFMRSRRTKIVSEYTSIFPDFLDLLVVCVDAGLSLNAALDRVTSEFYNRSKALASNFAAMLQEVRNGREIADALDNLSYRMDVDEIRSFCTLLKQSLELGSDVSQALRVYSEEMRIKRMLKAEEEANKLPVKMLLPLGLFIFPVILIVILSPIAVKISNMSK